MNYSKEFSVIVPVWRGAIKFLPKLFDSIPEKEGIEIIVVDNSKEPVSREEIMSKREIVFLHSEPERHAGGSRNDGIAVANGKWLLFADADDYYSPDAFDVYYKHLNSDSEIVYTGMGGVYEDTGEPSDRGDRYAKMVHLFVTGEAPESTLRYGFSSPCCKMFSHELVDRHQIRFDEVIASNDMYFSLLSGYYAERITAEDKVTYIATVNRGSLTRRRDIQVVESRYRVRLRVNQFLRQHELSSFQGSVMVFIKQAVNFGLNPFCRFIFLLFKYRQNPFIGWSRWIGSYQRSKDRDKKEKNYLTK